MPSEPSNTDDSLSGNQASNTSNTDAAISIDNNTITTTINGDTQTVPSGQSVNRSVTISGDGTSTRVRMSTQSSSSASSGDGTGSQHINLQINSSSSSDGSSAP